jgi:U4/U6 small nuclear ribonucleoprotein SNU13
MADQNDSVAWPKAEDPALVQELLDCVQQASHYRQLKKGANEATKAYVSSARSHFSPIRIFAN